MYILYCLIYYISFVSYVNAFALPFEGLYPLNIIHYNDFHARFEETSVKTPTCRTNDSFCLGGFPRIYHHIRTLLKEKPNAVLLNAGDSFQGTYWYTLLKWKITGEFMNLLPHDAHAIGNHEFDDGPEGLAPYLKDLKAPVVAANMDTTNEPSMQGLYEPHIVIERDGRKIGIIGLITTDTQKLSSPGKVVFTDPGEATRREAEALKAKGVDIIILLSHCGLDVDKELARDYGQYIDIIIGGHTHSLLWNGPSPSGEEVAGPYPVFIEASADKKHKVLIVQASAFTKYMGNLTVYFDFRGDFVKWDGGPIFLNRSIPEDPEVKAKLEPYAKQVRAAENIEVGATDTSLNFEDCVFGECALGDLLVDALAEHAKMYTKSDNDYIALMQRGNIRSTIPEGKITKGEIFELLPYSDRIHAFELEGKYIRAALERSVSEEWARDPFKGPWILQVSGLRVTYNVTQPQGSRIVKVTVGPTEDALNDDKHYQVTAPAFLADGGDGFTMFGGNRKDNKIIGRDEQVVTEYIEKNSPLHITTNKRIVLLS